jgi:hypothetical protein
MPPRQPRLEILRGVNLLAYFSASEPRTSSRINAAVGPKGWSEDEESGGQKKTHRFGSSSYGNERSINSPQRCLGDVAEGSSPSQRAHEGIATGVGVTKRPTESARPKPTLLVLPRFQRFEIAVQREMNAKHLTSRFMDYRRWLWLLTAFGLIGLGVAIAMVAKMPA